MRHKQTVEVAAGGGLSHDEIALGLGITTTELRKKYGRELSIGAHRKRIRVMVALYNEARVGNVAAAKVYMAHEVAMAAPPLQEAPAAGKKAKLGKKQQQALEAQSAEAGSEWEKLLNPKGSVQ